VNGQLHALAALTIAKEMRYQLYTMLGGFYGWSGHGGEDKNPYPSRPALSLVTILTEISQLHGSHTETKHVTRKLG